jgi:hypothetical protein
MSYGIFEDLSAQEKKLKHCTTDEIIQELNNRWKNECGQWTGNQQDELILLTAIVTEQSDDR